MELRQAAKAAAEFQKILICRVLVAGDRAGTMARLCLARAYAMEGATGKAKKAYQDFLELWKDADPNLPILDLGHPGSRVQ